MRKRLVSLLLLLVFLALGLSGAQNVSAFERDASQPLPDGIYKSWKQTDPRWSETVIGVDPWTDASGTRHTYETVGHGGCLITSMAILAKAHGLTLADGMSVTPGTLAEVLYDNGSQKYLTNGGAIRSHDVFGEVIPGVTYVSRVYSPSRSLIEEYLNDPDHTYFLIGGVNSGKHYVAIDYVSEKSVYICDPGRDEQLLSAYKCSFMHVYEADEDKVMPVDTGDPEGELWTVATESALRIRTGPGKDFSVKGAYSPGDLIEVIEIKEDGEYVWGRTIDGWTALRSVDGKESFCVPQNVRTHAVSMHANNGTEQSEPFEKEDGIPCTLPETIPEYPGNRFLGWARDPDAVSAEWVAGGPFSEDGVTDLYAVWIPEDKIFEFGVDVSSHQKEIDWKTTAESGVEFAIIRAGTSKGEDTFFEQNYAGAKEAGVHVGSYFYSYALTEDELVADVGQFISLLSGKQWDYPVFLDIESTAQKALGQETLTKFASTGVRVLEENGYYAGVYSSESWFKSLIRAEEIGGKDHVWMAKWMDSRTLSQNVSDVCSLYQYSDMGYIDGIPKRVDLDVSYLDYPSLIRSLGKNGFESQQLDPPDPPSPPDNGETGTITVRTDGTDVFYVGGRPGMTVRAWLSMLPEGLTAGLFQEDGSQSSPDDIIRTGLELRDVSGSGQTRIGEAVLPGDLTGDGRVSASDYAVAKRIVLNTYSLTGARYIAGCIGGDTVSARSYVLLKRHVLGTYDLFAGSRDENKGE